MLIWESNGVGRQFGARVMDLNYGDVYYRKKEDTITKKETLTPGWASSKETKLVLLGEYRLAVERQKIFNFSGIALDECLEYIFNSMGGVEHSKESNKEDPTGARENHGDRVIADALAWRGMTDRKPSIQEDSPDAPPGSLAWRIEQQRHQEREESRELSTADGW